MIKTPKHLAYELKFPLNEINYIIDNIDGFYSEWIIPKGTKTRVLNPSYRRLKVLQKRIQKNIIGNIQLPDYAYGAVKGRDNVLNANKHRGKKYKFVTDLRNFYPSISHNQVFKMFIDNGFSPEVSRLLTKLTTYKGRIPQGAPTSSTIANLVFVPTGNRLSSFCRKHSITLTTFVDDLTFSSPNDFKEYTPQILKIINDDGFKISHNKTSYSRNPLVTGLHPMNNHLKLPDQFIQKLKNPNGQTAEQKRGLQLYKDKVDKMNYG